MRFVALLTCLLGFAATATPVHAQPGTATVVGSWELVSYEDRTADGRIVRPYGDSPVGLLVYDVSGHMAIQIMKTPPPTVATDDWDKFTVAEKTALWDGYVAYFGRFEVDTARQLVFHLPIADLSRLYIGKKEERHFELIGDRLILSERWTQGGNEWSGVRIFQRLKR